MIYPESIIAIYCKSEELEMQIKDMLHSRNILLLTKNLIEE